MTKEHELLYNLWERVSHTARGDAQIKSVHLAAWSQSLATTQGYESTLTDWLLSVSEALSELEQFEDNAYGELIFDTHPDQIPLF